MKNASRARLLGGGLRELLAAVAGVDAVQRRQPVEVARAVAVVDVAALAAHDHGDLVVGEAAHPREVQPQVAPRALAEVAAGRRRQMRGAVHFGQP